jgi:hypothetical protein
LIRPLIGMRARCRRGALLTRVVVGAYWIGPV